MSVGGWCCNTAAATVQQHRSLGVVRMDGDGDGVDTMGVGMSDEEWVEAMQERVGRGVAVSGYGYLGASDEDEEYAGVGKETKLSLPDDHNDGEVVILSTDGKIAKKRISRERVEEWLRPQPGALLWAQWVLKRARYEGGEVDQEQMVAKLAEEDGEGLDWEVVGEGGVEGLGGWGRKGWEERAGIVERVEMLRGSSSGGGWEDGELDGVMVLDPMALSRMGGAVLVLGLDSMVPGEVAAVYGAPGTGVEEDGEEGEWVWKGELEMMGIVDVYRLDLHVLDPVKATLEAPAWGMPLPWTLDGDGEGEGEGVHKYVFVRADGFVSPIPGNDVVVRVWDGGDGGDGVVRSFTVGEGCDDVLEMGVVTMREGECSLLVDVATGEMKGVELISVDRGTPLHERCLDCKVDELARLKDVGNALFAEQRFQRALQVYGSAEFVMAAVDREACHGTEKGARVAYLESACYTNAALLLEREQQSARGTVHMASLAVEAAVLDPSLTSTLVKALILRAKARVRLFEYDAGLDDVSRVLELDPGNERARKLKARLRRLRSRSVKAEGVLFSRMVGAGAGAGA